VVTARIARRVRRRLGGREGEAGNAVVEFVGLALLLLVPLGYLIIALGQVQAGVFAAEGAAREAGRLVVRADELPSGVERARSAVALAFGDHGIDVAPAEALRLRCEADPCLTPGARVHVEVRAGVPLPGVPAAVRGAVPATVPVSAQYVAVVDEFREVPP
jgi:Flp pilus assembly protein TadG